MQEKLYLAFDIGGTAIKYGIITENGNFLYHSQFPNLIREEGVERMLEDIVTTAKNMQEQYELQAIGLSTSGVVDMKTGEMLRPADTFPGYKGKYPGQLLTEATGLPCHVDNDVNCAVLGEYHFGAAQGRSPVCCMAVGTGIGGATLIDGRLFYGATYFAGEIGHFPVPGGELEKVASTYALVKRVAAAKNMSEQQVNGKQIFAWAQAGDAVSIAAINDMMKTLAQGMVYLLYAFNPQIIVLGGAIAAQEAYLRPLLMEHLQRLVIPELLENTEIAFSQLNNTASMLGAVSPYLKPDKA